MGMYVCKSFRIFIIAGYLLSLLASCETSRNETEPVQPEQSVQAPRILLSCPASLIPTGDQKEAIKKQINFGVKQQVLDSIFTQKHVSSRFNGCVLVAEKGVILYQNCFGNVCNTNKGKDTLLINSRFQLASMTKTFTAVAVLKLMEENKLSLEDSVQKFFPEFPYTGITVKMLLNHRSGLPYYAYVFHDSIRWAQYGPDNAEVLRWYIEDKPAVYSLPDRKFAYNNTNYMLLALIIEKVSGLSYTDYIRKKICLPLGMKNTFVFDPENDSMMVNITCGHERKKEVAHDYFDLVMGDKGIYSTVEDLFLWYMALNSECILKKETLALAFQPYSFENPGKRNYGLGFRMILKEGSKEPKYIYHNGWWKGYNTLFWMIPEKNVAIIILSNHRNRTVYDIKKVLKVFEPEESIIDDGEE